MDGVNTTILDGGDGFAINRVQDVEPILAFTKGQRGNRDVGSTEMRHAASLPMVLVEAYCNDKHITFEQFMADETHVKIMLNDPALKYFRIWEGRV
jgi:hypothetical protein